MAIWNLRNRREGVKEMGEMQEKTLIHKCKIVLEGDKKYRAAYKAMRKEVVKLRTEIEQLNNSLERTNELFKRLR